MLSLDNLTKYFGERAVLDHINWSMSDDDRVGLIGLNGAGKTTLMRLIAGIVEPDFGRVSRPQKTNVGYLAQDSPDMGGRALIAETMSGLAEIELLDAERRQIEVVLSEKHSGPEHDAALERLGEVLTELERHDFYTAESRAESVLFGLGFKESDLKRDVNEFSGGIRMRIALAKILLQQPEFIMLDEPTNHLDLEARNWLEEYLVNYPGGILVVSHDRYFLDQVTRRTIELSRGKVTEYSGNYSKYLVQREERFRLELAAYENQREEIEHIESFISRFRAQASKAKLVQSRIKQLEKIERLEPPVGADKPPAINFPDCVRSGRTVLTLQGAVKRYDDLTVYSGIDMTIERGLKVALVGPNGAGKSTLMKILAGVEPLSGGERIVGHNAAIGYFAQDLGEALNGNNTVLDELSAEAQGMTTTEIRSLLGAMLFSGDDVMKKVGVLSGGERGRLALAKVLAHRNNVLLLDEPTNNLDIIAKDTLLEALKRFSGTVVIVSHDRYILDALATEVLEVGKGHAIRYLGNYEEYLEKKQAMELAAAASSKAAAAKVAAPIKVEAAKATGKNGASAPAKPQVDREGQKKRDQALRRRQQIESEIEKKETEHAEIGAVMNKPNFYLERADANDLIKKYEALAEDIERLYLELEKYDAAAAS